MTDEEYIRRAVELADGRWAVSDKTGQVFIVPFFNVSYPPNEVPQWALDALAAQLVRQVDAIDGVDLLSEPMLCKILRLQDAEPFAHWVQIGRSNGDDRTMNTIKAIVDSGVLSTGGRE